MILDCNPWVNHGTEQRRLISFRRSVFEQFLEVVGGEVDDERVRRHLDELFEVDPFVAVLVPDGDDPVHQVFQLLVVEL